jgi:iron complex outermembrane recepter protein
MQKLLLLIKSYFLQFFNVNQPNYCMTKFYKRLLLPLTLLLLAATASVAQTTISGSIKDGSTGEPLAGVNIIVKGRVIGTISDGNGKFNLKVNDSPPLSLTVSFVGFKSQEVAVTNANTTGLEVTLEEQTLLGQEVVISASRVEENIMRSPVTVEKVDLIGIQQSTAPEYFDALANVKGVQVTSSSLNFPAINTRGFATIANERFVQWIDGIDAAAPILNFPTGNIVGIGELDAESMELIPGAASALYGPNAFNGILIQKSKSPFEFQGLSAQVKTGVTNSDAQGEANPYVNFGVRYAKAFNNKFAFKVNFSYFDATDWSANDYKQDRVRSLSETDLSGTPDFDGVNTYGDEAVIPPTGFGFTLRRTGFKEEDIIDDYSARSIKGDIALHYRLTDKVELLANYRYGSGNAVYQGDAKYALRDFTQEFYKVEAKADNFFVRGYLTQTDAGDSYNLLALGSFMNEELSPTQAQWAPNYLGAYLGVVPGINPGDHAAARAWADNGYFNAIGQPQNGRPTPGTPAFKTLTERVRNQLFQGSPPGATFRDDSRLWHGEFNYNFKNQVQFAEIMIGGNIRQYDLFTNGTILNEDPIANTRAEANFERIRINEFGAYTQLAKTFGNLKVTGSIRYDKNENFDGQVTPRISGVYTFSEDHNVRGSFQTGFRNPQTQAQFIYFPASDAILLGSAEANASRYGVHNGGSYTRDSYRAYQASGGSLDPTTGALVGGNTSLLVDTNVPYVQPEQLQAFEVGYKGLFGSNILVDLNVYYSIYNDFIGTDFVASRTPSLHQGTTLAPGTIFSLYSNSSEQITSLGAGLGVTYNLPKGYSVNANYNYADFAVDEVEGRTFNAGFNTPNNKFSVGFGNRKLTKNLGFNLNYRWQEGFDWFSSYGEWFVPEFGVFDAAVSYRVSSIKSMVKIGGTNLGGSDYRTNLGGPFVGQMYYVSLTFDQFFK